ncbi:MAG TPA: ATPase domain-containing protein [Methylophilaceae bacterium]|nr:ATPase domain-containing protein [Methylophilaceae bacterium]
MTTRPDQSRKSGLPLISTGIKGFDTILGGGLPKSGLYLVQGLAGSGKTTLAGQIGFHHARQGGKVILMTLIAESHGKLLNHLSNYSFYDENLLGSKIFLFSGYHHLARKSLNELMSFITSTLAEHKPDMLIIDGFRSVREAGTSSSALSEFMHTLNSLGTTMGCTTLLLSPIEGNQPESENTLVDGLIELGNVEKGMRIVRELQIYKIRGGKHLLGRHTFEIDTEGIIVYPRLEALTSNEKLRIDASDHFLRFGIPGWDELIHGGIEQGSTSNLIGHPGTGKTLMGLSFLNQGILEGEQCLMLGFYESVPRLMLKAQAVGLNLQSALDSGQLNILWLPPLEFLMDEVAGRVLAAVEQRKVSRLFVDGIEGFEAISIHNHRVSSFLLALISELRAQAVTTIITQELPYLSVNAKSRELPTSALFENIFLLKSREIAEKHYRQISVMKLREHDYDASNRILEISDSGLRLGGLISSIEKHN